MRLSWPLIGRAGEMRTIEAAISASAVSGILVCGPAGVGKSRIAREALSGRWAHLPHGQFRWVLLLRGRRRGSRTQFSYCEG
jgi:hypothetical protein